MNSSQDSTKKEALSEQIKDIFEESRRTYDSPSVHAMPLDLGQILVEVLLAG